MYVTEGGEKYGLPLAHLHIVLWVDGMRDFIYPWDPSLSIIGLLTKKLSLIVNVRKVCPMPPTMMMINDDDNDDALSPASQWPRKTTELLDCWLSGALTAMHHDPNVRKLDVKVKVLNRKYRRVLKPYKRMLAVNLKRAHP